MLRAARSISGQLRLHMSARLTRRGFMGVTVEEASGEPHLPAFGLSNLGHLANSSVVCSQGDTVVHAAVSIKRKYSADQDFLPMTVDYRDRMYARGVIPSGAATRERHGTNDETLVGRMVDRAMRPLFPHGYVDDLQVLVTCHAADGHADPTVMGLNAASCALLLSSAPWKGPIGCVRIGRIDGKLVVNPSVQQMQESTLDLVYAGTMLRTVMLEASGKEVPESEVKGALRLAHSAIQPIIHAQLRLREKQVESKQRTMDAVAEAVAKTNLPSLWPVVPAEAEQLEEGGADIIVPLPLDARSRYEPMFTVKDELVKEAEAIGLQTALDVFRASLPRSERSKREGAVRFLMINTLRASEAFGSEHPVSIQMAAEEVMCKAFRSVVFEGSRVDGRGQNVLRTIDAEPAVLPVVHGSSFFQRGDTHVLCTTTLGSLLDLKKGLDINGGTEEQLKPFMLHYDFPPYCTGVVDSIKLNRRMIGHGALAEKAVRAVMPSVDEFPYLVRVFSECTSSNGSSSMASVCGASLALMDAGVPIRSAVAGVSVGMVCRDNLRLAEPVVLDESGSGDAADRAIAADVSPDSWLLLTDILGMEDHYGDMDFKIAGSAKGITAVQLDVKLANGIPLKALEDAISVSREARLKILDTMNAKLSAPRDSFKPQAPLAAMVKFDPERRRYLLGTGNEMARYIRLRYAVDLDLNEEGGGEGSDGVASAYIFGKNPALVRQAKALVQDLVLTLSVGENCTAVVSEVKDFGALVKITRGQEALLHYSDLTYDPKLRKRPITELLAVGQRIPVQVTSFNKATGQVRVSRKLLLPSPEENPAFVDVLKAEAAPEDSLLEPLPEFPLIPPRRFSKDFFRNNVVSEDAVASALGMQNGQARIPNKDPKTTDATSGVETVVVAEASNNPFADGDMLDDSVFLAAEEIIILDGHNDDVGSTKTSRGGNRQKKTK